MEDSHKSDQELLQCPPRVDTSTFPKASANKIAQNFGKYIYICVMHRMRNTRGGSHVVHFDVASTTMLTGTNQKAQQSCGSGTVRE